MTDQVHLFNIVPTLGDHDARDHLYLVSKKKKKSACFSVKLLLRIYCYMAKFYAIRLMLDYILGKVVMLLKESLL